MDVAGEFLKEGLLGTIIVALGIAVTFLYRENKSLTEKRVEDVKSFSASFLAASEKMIAVNKELLSSNAVLQKSVDTMSSAVQNLVNGK